MIAKDMSNTRIGTGWRENECANGHVWRSPGWDQPFVVAKGASE